MNKQPDRIELLQGALDLLVLRILSREKLHGYSVARGSSSVSAGYSGVLLKLRLSLVRGADRRGYRDALRAIHGRRSAASASDGSQYLCPASFNAMTPRPEAFVRIRHGLGYWAGNDGGHHLAGASADNGSVHNVAFPDQHIGYFTLISGGDNAVPVIRSAHA